MTVSADCPVLVPSMSHITRLLVDFHHLCTFHGGVNSTLTSLRQHFWIPKGRSTVKRVLRSCTTCARKTRTPLTLPGPPALPLERVTLIRPFLNIGVDYSGHVLIKDPQQPDLTTKGYICLFTCMASRAVHLELAKDLSAETFLNLLVRFVCEYGVPHLIVSDNGSNFVATESALRNIAADTLVKDYTEERFIKWKFIRPRAPWEGGFYERLIGLVKSTLFKMITRKILQWDELFTLLKGAQLCVNNRPLTYVNSDDPLDLPLTPNHLVKGRRIDTFPTCELPTHDDPDYENPDHLRESYNYMMTLQDKFKTLWRKGYLIALRERHLTPSMKQKLNVKVGDIVLVETEEIRDYWPLGKIERLLPDKRDQVRAAEVYVGGKLVTKTLDKLIPLEVSSRFHDSDRPYEQAWSDLIQNDATNEDPSEELLDPIIEQVEDPLEPPLVEGNPEFDEEHEARPRRKTARKALDKFQNWGDEGLI